MWPALMRCGCARRLWKSASPELWQKRITVVLLAASGFVYLFVLARCGYHSIMHVHNGSGDLRKRTTLPTGLAVVVLAVATAWAVLFTGMTLSSGFSWGHIHHARDNVSLLYRYPRDRERRARVLEWIHVADLTTQNQLDYQDQYTVIRGPLAPLPFVPNAMEVDDEDLASPTSKKCPCPEDLDPEVNLWKLSDACQAVEDYVENRPYLYNLVSKERSLYASTKDTRGKRCSRVLTKEVLRQLWEKKSLDKMFPDLWPLLNCDVSLLSQPPEAPEYCANKPRQSLHARDDGNSPGGPAALEQMVMPDSGSGSLLKKPLTPSPGELKDPDVPRCDTGLYRRQLSFRRADDLRTRVNDALTREDGRHDAMISRSPTRTTRKSPGLVLPRLPVGSRVCVGTTFLGWQTDSWVPTGLKGTVIAYGEDRNTEGMFRVVWDDPEFDLLQNQWVHPIHWRYIQQLCVFEETRPGWALRRKCLSPPKVISEEPAEYLMPGDLVTHEHRPIKWYKRRLYCRDSTIAARDVQYEIVRKLGRAERPWVRLWGTVTWFWLPLCVATGVCSYWHVWVRHWKAAATVMETEESPVEIAELGLMPIASIVKNAAAMCDAFDIVASPMTIGTLKLVFVQIAVTIVFGQGRAGESEEDWRVSVRKARQQKEGDGCCSRCSRTLQVVGKILFAVYNIAMFALALARNFVLFFSAERRLSWWDDYETFLAITVINPAVMTLVQLLLRLRTTAPPRSLQRTLYFYGLCVFCCFGIPAFLTHIGLAVLVVIGALVLLPLAMPLAAVVSYLFPGAEPVFATIVNDTLGMLSVVGVLTLSAAAAALMFAVVYPLVMFCAALLTAVRNWPGINSVNCGFWDSTERRWQKFYDACHAVSQGPSCRRRHKPAFPRKIRVRVFEKLPQDQGPEVKKQFEWFKQKGLNGKVAEFTGAFAGYFAVWTFENGAKYWMDTDFVRVVERAPAFRGRLKMVIASVTGSLPAAVASVVKANIVRFVLQSFTLYMVLWYAGNPLSKVAEEEFHARSVNLYARCFLGDMFRTWDNMQHMFSWL